MVGVPGDDEFFPAGFDFVIAGGRGNAQNVVIMLESRGRGRRTGFVIVADEFEIAVGEFNDIGSVLRMSSCSLAMMPSAEAILKRLSMMFSLSSRLSPAMRRSCLA